MCAPFVRLRVRDKLALIKAQRYAHAKQFKRHKREVKFLKVRLGRVIRDIRRKIKTDAGLEAAFFDDLTMAVRLRLQKKRQDGPKLYSLHAPETECIGKGKAHKPYEFGCKVSIATTNAKAPGGMFALHAKALHGNPYDGHTLRAVIEELTAGSGENPNAFASTRVMWATMRHTRAASFAPVKSAAFTE